MSLYPNAPPTSTPNSLALSPDGRRCSSPTADNNAVAVVDVSNTGRSIVNGFMPTGWYPTGAIFSRDGKQIFVLSGKGLTPAAEAGRRRAASVRLQGAVSDRCRRPIAPTLADYTRRVLRADAVHRRDSC